jgi:hypothetical protein
VAGLAERPLRVNLRYPSGLLIPDVVIALCEFSTGLVGLAGRGTSCGSGGAGRWFAGGPSTLLTSYILPLSSRRVPSASLIFMAEAREETLRGRRKKVGWSRSSSAMLKKL